jgi:hypothetical protein
VNRLDGASVTGAMDVLFYGALPPGGVSSRSEGDGSLWEIH